MSDKKKIKYDCLKCPGYCCSYDRIEASDSDVKRLAKHFGMSIADADKKFFRWYKKKERILRHQKDDVYGSICRFFDTDERRCTVYKARPAVCREYPNGNRCGYYSFIKFERKHQDDKDFIPSA
jgi:Fe-S-cluster containining protein